MTLQEERAALDTALEQRAGMRELSEIARVENVKGNSMTFEEWFDRDCECGKADKRRKVSIKDYARGVWDAATEEVKKDHYRIGEEVEAIGIDGLPAGYVKVQVIARKEGLSVYISDPKRIRRIPAWEPKEGEAVMFPWYNIGNVRTWNAGIYKNGRIYFADDNSKAAVEYCKPFDPDKIGKQWDEV